VSWIERWLCEHVATDLMAAVSPSLPSFCGATTVRSSYSHLAAQFCTTLLLAERIRIRKTDTLERVHT
jgi:hypothetical protein